MPFGPEGTREKQDGFREAIARWRLDLRTEVKKSSSLPTAMFDACDPMLEARLAETARAMLARLQGAEPPVTGTDAALVEKRVERVTEDDLKKLPAQVAAIRSGPVDLEHGLFAEYLGILIDTCCHGEGAAQQGAAHLLTRDFDLSTSTDLHTLHELVALQVLETPECVKAATFTDEQLAVACQRVAAALVLHTSRDGGGTDA